MSRSPTLKARVGIGGGAGGAGGAAAAGVGAALTAAVSRLAPLSADVGARWMGVFDATVPDADGAGRGSGGLRDGVDCRVGRAGTVVGGVDADGVPVSAGNPSRPIESAVAVGRTRVDSALVVAPVVRCVPSPSPPAHDANAVNAIRRASTSRNRRNGEVSIDQQAITARAMIRRLR